MAAMRRMRGLGAGEGIAIGLARALPATVVVVQRRIPRQHVQGELLRLAEAIQATDCRLARIGQELEGRHEPDGGHLLECYRLILRGGEILTESHGLIRQELLAAESAVRQVIDRMAAAFAGIRDPTLRERSEDVQAVGDHLLRTMLGLPDTDFAHGWAAGAIAVGAALSPIDALSLERLNLAGIATERGGVTSHAAVIVRGLRLPHVVGVAELGRSARPGDTLIVDGGRGEVIINPDRETLVDFRRRRGEKKARMRRLLRAGRARPTATADGVEIELGANIERLSEVATAVDLGARSVGLLRTELLYLNCPHLPSEEDQYRDAVAALTALGGRTATFRTLDLGGEKLPLGVRVPGGANPSLGVRAIRFSLRRPDIFRVQLRALYRASVVGPMRIMFPLISSVAELCAARAVCEEVQAELDREGVAYRRHLPIGAMIETPSAALTIDHLARCCDFFSIGTNDLIQYAFAADRDNVDVAHLCRALHPAVVRLLKHAIDAAAVAGKPIAVCGDIAGDAAFTWVLLGLGVRELSMAPRDIPAVRSVVVATRLAEAQALVAEALALDSERAVEDFVLGAMRQRFPLEVAAEGHGAAGARAQARRVVHPPVAVDGQLGGDSPAQAASGAKSRSA